MVRNPTAASSTPTSAPIMDRRSQIVEAVRAAIVDGTHPAGSQLPNQSELARQFGVSGFTVQRALNQLAQEGFIRKRPRLGTHVVDIPPHLRDLALVFAYDPVTNAHASKLYHALAAAANDFQRLAGRNVFQFHGVDGRANTPDHLNLLGKLRAHQLAGIVFSHPPRDLEGTPILEQPGIPRVTFSSRQYYPGIPAVTTDGQGFFDRALDYLLARGRRRIALLLVPSPLPGGDPHLDHALAARGLSVPPHWRQTLSQSAAEGACNCVRLLMYGAGDARPDGLIVADDNLVEHAQAGLIAAGVRVPDDLEVVEHCNFPWPRSVLPTKRLGFDSQAVLRVCVELVDCQRRGEPVVPLTRVPAIFEEELSTDTPLNHCESG